MKNKEIRSVSGKIDSPMSSLSVVYIYQNVFSCIFLNGAVKKIHIKIYHISPYQLY